MKSETKYFLGAGFIILLLLVVLGLGPLLTIASLNTLFNLGIAYNVWTYLSVCWMNLTTFGGLGLAIRNLKK